MILYQNGDAYVFDYNYDEIYIEFEFILTRMKYKVQYVFSQMPQSIITYFLK